LLLFAPQLGQRVCIHSADFQRYHTVDDSMSISDNTGSRSAVMNCGESVLRGTLVGASMPHRSGCCLSLTTTTPPPPQARASARASTPSVEAWAPPPPDPPPKPSVLPAAWALHSAFTLPLAVRCRRPRGGTRSPAWPRARLPLWCPLWLTPVVCPFCAPTMAMRSMRLRQGRGAGGRLYLGARGRRLCQRASCWASQPCRAPSRLGVRTWLRIGYWGFDGDARH
jgi:hypothetical protein